MDRSTVRVLVVDDDRSLTEMIEEHISDSGDNMAVRYAETEGEVLDLMMSWDPSVVLLDAHASKLDSLFLLESRMAELAPVIVTSDQVSKEIEEAARLKGAVGYVTKCDGLDELDHLLSCIAQVAINFQQTH